MKSLLLTICLLTASFSVMADPTLSCIGVDNGGQAFTLLTTWSEPEIVNINGFKHKLVGWTKNHRGQVTANFTLPDGTLVYDSLMPFDHAVMIYQFNAYTNELLGEVALTCDMTS